MLLHINHSGGTDAEFLLVVSAAVAPAADGTGLVSARARRLCPGAHPRVDGLHQGVEIGKAGADDADVELEAGPGADVEKARCVYQVKSWAGMGDDDS